MFPSPLLKYRRPHKKSSHYRIALLKSLFSADNLLVKTKNPSRPGCRRAERIFTGKLSAGRRLLKGDTIMEHRNVALYSFIHLYRLIASSAAASTSWGQRVIDVVDDDRVLMMLIAMDWVEFKIVTVMHAILCHCRLAGISQQHR